MSAALLSRPLRLGLGWLGLGLALWFLVGALGAVLTPFVVSAILAYMLHPVVAWVGERVRINRRSAPKAIWVALVEVLFFLLLISLFLLLVPIFTKELPILRMQIPLMLDSAVAWAGPRLAALGIPLQLEAGNLQASARVLLEDLNIDPQALWSHLVNSIKMGGSLALTIVGNLFLIPVILFYLLMEWERLLGFVQDLLPRKSRLSINGFLQETDQVMGQYLHGQLLVMLAMAVYYSVALKLFGLDLALPIGIFTGLAVLVPYVGFAFGLLLALMASVLQFGLPFALVVVAVVYGAGQLLESIFVTPYLLGQRVGLHPLAVIFLLMAFGQLFGFVGVLLAVPLGAVLAVGLQRLVRTYKRSALYLDV